MRPNKKIRAGALQFVLLIGTLISVLLLTFVLLHQTHSLFVKKTAKTIEVIQKADLGLQLALQQEMALNDSVSLSMESGDGIALTAVKTYWGVFEKYTMVSQFGKTRFVKTALVGGGVEEDFSALYIKDNNRPMIVAGKSKISGDAHVPQQGIRQGTIRGQFHQFGSPVYGRLKTSSSTLPALNSGLRTHMKQLIAQEMGGFGQNTIRFSRGLAYSNSFGSPTQYLQGDVIRLSGTDLRGNIVVKASQQIIVGRDSYLKDVVLVAPQITIENGFKGSLQAIATHGILVGEGVMLEYPSALVVERGSRPNPKEQCKANITIAKGTEIGGVIAYFENSEERNYFPQITIAEKVLVQGEIYCEKNLELKGNVIGNVTTDAFVALENGSVYQNHLFQGTINATLIPEPYAGLLYNTKKAVAKWLY